MNMAVWRQALYDEYAVSTEDGDAPEVSATGLVDLTKAFESIPLWRVWLAGVKYRFPLPILRLALEICCFERHLTYRQHVGQGILSYTAILAGTSAATDLLFLVMVDPCDATLSKWPGSQIDLMAYFEPY